MNVLNSSATPCGLQSLPRRQGKGRAFWGCTRLLLVTRRFLLLRSRWQMNFLQKSWQEKNLAVISLGNKFLGEVPARILAMKKTLS